MSFARLAQLEVADTLHLFGKHYRDFVEDEEAVPVEGLPGLQDLPGRESSKGESDEYGAHPAHVDDLRVIKHELGLPGGEFKEWPPPDVANLKAFKEVCRHSRRRSSELCPPLDPAPSSTHLGPHDCLISCIPAHASPRTV